MPIKKYESLNSDNPNNTEIKSPSMVIFWLGILGVFGFAVGNYFYVSSSYCSMAARGQFGDMYGALNSIFSGLAFVAVAFTLWEQRVDLRRQHQQNSINQEFLKTAARREELRYLNDVLPNFSFEDDLSQTAEEYLEFVKFEQKIKNTGHKVIDVTFTQMKDKIPSQLKETKKDHNFEDQEFILPIWCPIEESHNVQYFSVSFRTMDRVIWEDTLVVEILNGRIINSSFGFPKENYKKVEEAIEESLKKQG